MSSHLAEVEPRVQEIGRKLLDGARAQRPWWRGIFGPDPLLDPMMRDEALRIASLRFVDVLPALHDSAELTTHLEDYFREVRVPWVPTRMKRWALRASRGRMPAGPVAWFVRALAGRMAHRFIAGDTVDSVRHALEDLHRRGMGFTLDLLGEAVVSEPEADHYRRQYLDLLAGLEPVVRRWEPNPLLDRLGDRRSPRLNLSIKPSALYPQINAVDPEGSASAIFEQIKPILLDARRRGAFITLDMEHYDTKEITLRVLHKALKDPDLRDWPDIGVAIQAYLRDTPRDLAELIEFAKRRATPFMVRLVRGAYWDFEVVHAQQHGWRIPVWTRKADCDVCYERCLAMLFESHPHVETAVATHNVRSLAVAMALAERLGLAPHQYETQMLYGMADELKESLVQEGLRLRVYVPFGELIPGMAYLVRRLLENTGSQSFHRMGSMEHVDPATLLAPPKPDRKAAERSGSTAVSDPIMTIPPFANEPVRRFTDESERRSFSAALDTVRGQLGRGYPVLIAGKEHTTSAKLESINPAEPSQVVGIASSASRDDARNAIAAAADAFPAWRDTPVETRAAILLRAAELMRGRRDELAAWEVFEAGKPWREADADLCEAIDFLRYYAREAVRLSLGHTFDVPGETNRYFYEPRGVAVVISPWNFPLAILCGMSAAALATGNTVVMKPAPQTPVIASHFARILHEAGLPPGVLNYLPGGDEAGDALVRDPRTAMIAFTGSVPVGTFISRAAADRAESQHHFKHVIAELGGKNAIIVDTDADLDDAVLGVIHSAFDYAGQKCSACSRLIVVGDLYEPFLDRLTEAAASTRIGPPTDPGVLLGPVIDKDSFDRIHRAIEEASSYCRLRIGSETQRPGPGYFIAPTIFSEVPPDSPLAQTEIFGPVLAAMRADSFDHALELANNTRYALTGGVYSRSPTHLETAKQKFRVGNLYLNRKITGAVVGRQPFGGFKLSGTDAKAGGPDYLLHFVHPRHVTENTLRRGFAPDVSQEPDDAVP